MHNATADSQLTAERRTTTKFLTFLLDNEYYGVEVMKIREIIRMQKITPVPQMPAHVKGVINLRGKVIPVMDLRLRFSLNAKNADDNTCIVVVNLTRPDGSSVLTGLVVDAVEEVLNINDTDIEQAPEIGSQITTECILGLAKTKNTVVTLLAIELVVLGTDAA
jgi:purine-binding chemotaxis protein CheW